LSIWKEKGYIRRDPTKPRAIEVLGNKSSVIQVPVVGRVAAGKTDSGCGEY